MKLYKPTSKFKKNFKDTNLASYIISNEGKIYMRTYPNGKIDDEWNENDWNDEVLVMRVDETLKEKYVVIEDVVPFRINEYCMSADYGVVKIAWIEEHDDYNSYYFVWGNRCINHYGNPETLRYLTQEEIVRYIA